MSRISAFAGILLLASGIVSAAENNGFYVGAGFGRSIGDRDGFRAMGSERIRQNDSSWTTFGGYRILEGRAAIEAGYSDLGNQKNPGWAGCAYAREDTIRNLYLRANGRLPLSSRLSVTAHGGAARATYSLLEYPSTNRIPGISCAQVLIPYETPEDETALLWGAGADWDFGTRWRVRAEWSRYELENTPKHELSTYILSVILKL